MKNGKDHPFYAFTVHLNDEPVVICHVDEGSRLAKVKEFDARTCKRALQVKFLQKTVRIAIERRLRKLAQ